MYDEELALLKLVKKADERLLPFKHLLRVINKTHTEGNKAKYNYGG